MRNEENSFFTQGYNHGEIITGTRLENNHGGSISDALNRALNDVSSHGESNPDYEFGARYAIEAKFRVLSRNSGHRFR